MNKAIAILLGLLGVVWVSVLDMIYKIVVAMEHDAWTDFGLAIIAVLMVLGGLGTALAAIKSWQTKDE